MYVNGQRKGEHTGRHQYQINLWKQEGHAYHYLVKVYRFWRKLHLTYCVSQNEDIKILTPYFSKSKKNLTMPVF